MNGDSPLLGIIISLVALAVTLAVLFFIIQGAIVTALREARREAWTETHMPEKARWLSQRQRDELAAARDDLG